MGDSGKPSIRIDWFDGSLIEDAKPSTSRSQLNNEEQPEPETIHKPGHTENKPIGYKRLLDISLLEPSILTVEVTHRPGFWNLFDQVELKGDFIVLIVRVLTKVYKEIQPGDRTKITKLLETRFLESDFIEKLTNFIMGLPNVKIVDKRMNSQLWDDVEGFYFQIIELCKGIMLFSEKHLVKTKLKELINSIDQSVLGVAKEHSERFSDELFKRIEELHTDLSVEADMESIQFDTAKVSSADPNNFRNLNIFPTRQDLMTLEDFTDKKVTIEPNIINGAYPNVEHYLDLQFKLLREDYFAPLREGICMYLENPSKRRHENIRIYPEVRVLRTYVSNNKVGYLIDIAWKERTNHLSIKKKQYIKQLMFGSLLLFTSDNFKTILCATVLDASMELLRKGYLAVSFQNPVSKNILSEIFLMVESEVFFEPYHQVLNVFQKARFEELPMRNYIVDVKAETHAPAYLTHDTLYTIEAPDKSEIPFPVLDVDQWPDETIFGLDNSQYKAFQFALTREFAVIQGPPGTGKTFLGIKIASTILKNLSLEGTPMLVICYTNHALDQFLEGILNVTDSVIRLGSQSKSKQLDAYNLNNVRAKIKSKYSYIYANKRAELEKIYKEMTDLQTEIEKCEQGIISFKCIKPHLKIDGKEFELHHSEEDSVLHWLFEHLEESKHPHRNTKTEEDSWENLELVTNGKLETCFTEKGAINEMKSLQNMIKHVNDNRDSFSNPEAVKKFEDEIHRIKKRLDSLRNNMTSYKNNKDAYKIDNVQDLNMLSVPQRWQLYFNAVREIKNGLLNKMDALLEKHNTANEELEEVSTLLDGEVVRGARVVGVTTTAAARRHQLVKKIRSPIVIVEEAAEILEAHIVASLTSNVQHLILIGDHKQLRPTTAHYRLAKEFNLEISLFERMIRNGIHAVTLTTQRRMRPEFVDLLVPAIYERLECHESVLEYPDVAGMWGNLYFFSHEYMEDSESMEDSWSYKNTFEAKWSIAQVHHLREMGYDAADVTILTTYSGQVSLIKKLSQKFQLLRDVKITTVDNFQGEESRIVVLSLVRSNTHGSIGFLSAPNRICVAMSRAKEGFYIFGNMSLLKSASPIWLSIYERLVALNAIGNRLNLPITAYDCIRNVIDMENPNN